MKLKEAIKKAQEYAKENYIKSIGTAHNPAYKRKWREVKLNDGRIAYALEGTPDKAFVFVSVDKKLVSAYDQAENKLIEISVAD